jgi:type VI secretion system secreted protein VgrG
VVRAVLSPRLWLLTRTQDCRIYQNQTVPEVVKSVLREHAIPFSERLQVGNYRRWDYLTQYRESDFDFVSRIMEQEGIYYYFKHSADKHELVLADSLASHDPVIGYERIPTRPPGQGKIVADHLSDWHPVHRVTSARITLQDHDFRLRGGSDILAVKAAEADHPDDELEVYDYPGEQVVGPNEEAGDAGATRQAGEHYAMARLHEARAQRERVEAQGNARGIEAGAIIQIDTVLQMQKKYLVVRTDHELRNLDLGGGGGFEHQLCQVRLTALDSERPFRPERSTHPPVIAGPQTATVVGQAGEEIWTDKHGRVKVQFHWDREGKSDENSSCWVRVGQVWAGSNFGGVHIPRIGHEVIVQFLEGDPNRPVITGSLYNADNQPPIPLPGGATQSGIRSRSTKGGTADNYNEIRFEDKKGAEQLGLQAEKDMNTLVKNDQSTTVGNDQTISVKANRSVSVSGNESHSVTGTRSLSVTGKDSQSFASDRQISVTGTDTHNITGARTESYDGGRSRTIKAFDNTTVEGANKQTTVSGKYDISADAQYTVKQAGNQLYMNTAVMLQAMADMVLNNPGATVSFAEGNLSLIAASELSLVCGSASITLRSDGTVTISGSSNVTAVSGESGLELVPGGATVSSANSTVVAGKTVTEIVGGVVKIN